MENGQGAKHLHHDRSLTPVPPPVGLLAIRLAGRAAKSLVIPVGEGYSWFSLRETQI